jgi:hypothetical protein
MLGFFFTVHIFLLPNVAKSSNDDQHFSYITKLTKQNPAQVERLLHEGEENALNCPVQTGQFR